MAPADHSPSHDQAIDEQITAILDDVGATSLTNRPGALPVYDVLRYHLGRVNEFFEPERSDPGKRIRPKLCVHCCQGAGGSWEQALPVAAAIELIHNFTLIHDDIQDRSHFRRHRPTIWKQWGESQAINAGDAMFAAAYLALERAPERGVAADVTLDLSSALHRTTLKIVEGQVLDLGFEERGDVTADDYRTMITGKTAAIMRYACWSGAIVAGVPPRLAETYGDFGEALGIGFQVRDDLLGIWGAASDTGKEEAGDIHRRKKTLPVLMLLDRASKTERARIQERFAAPKMADAGVEDILDLMRTYRIEGLVQAEVEKWHDLAQQRLDAIGPAEPARTRLESLVETMAGRTS